MSFLEPIDLLLASFGLSLLLFQLLSQPLIISSQLALTRSRSRLRCLLRSRHRLQSGLIVNFSLQGLDSVLLGRNSRLKLGLAILVLLEV